MITEESASVSTKVRLARLARRVLPATTVRLAHVEPGLKLEVNLKRNVMFWTQGLAAFETECVAILRSIVEPGDTFFDVGANIGFYATLAARLVGERGTVVAFEPDPQNLKLLRRNASLNKCDNLEVRPVAVGAEEGQASFSLDSATGATGHLGEDLTQGEETVGQGRVIIVQTEVETIDSVARSAKVRPNVIKLDIEGGECEALRGARNVLAESRPIVISELNGAGGQEVLEILSGAGYRIWDLETGRIVDPSEPRPFMVVALPEESVETPRGQRLIMSLPRR
jgi:FkbM family methyltransferase